MESEKLQKMSTMELQKACYDGVFPYGKSAGGQFQQGQRSSKDTHQRFDKEKGANLRLKFMSVKVVLFLQSFLGVERIMWENVWEEPMFSLVVEWWDTRLPSALMFLKKVRKGVHKVKWLNEGNHNKVPELKVVVYVVIDFMLYTQGKKLMRLPIWLSIG